MTYSLAISKKDLSPVSSKLQTVSGVAKLKQDMFAYIAEAYQVDRFHPQYGSTVSSYVGQQNTLQNAFEIQIEVRRALTNLQKYQKALYDKDNSVFSSDELLDTINEVNIVRNLDQLEIQVIFTTAGSITETISVEVN